MGDGVLRAPDSVILGIDGRPDAVKNSLGYTLRRLGTDYVDVYRLGRVDPAVPIEETVGAIAELVEAGYVCHVGLSEAGAETLRRACAVHPVSDLQIEYSLLSRGIEREILPACRELGVGVTAYGVVSRGLISSHCSRERPLAEGDFRGGMPRFSSDNLEHNLALVEALRAIAWALSRGDDIVPLVGARRRDPLEEALGALEIELTADDVVAIGAVPRDAAAGERYDERQMAILDSERG